MFQKESKMFLEKATYPLTTTTCIYVYTVYEYEYVVYIAYISKLNLTPWFHIPTLLISYPTYNSITPTAHTWHSFISKLTKDSLTDSLTD